MNLVLSIFTLLLGIYTCEAGVETYYEDAHTFPGKAKYERYTATKKPCLLFPALPMNSHRKCSPDYCTITCTEGHKFIDGTSDTNMRCVNGKWQPTRADLSFISDCQPECNPPCANGGVCLSANTCQCPIGYGGPQCEDATKKPCLLFPALPMNSHRKCSRDYCTITCEEGYKFIDGTSVTNMQCVNGKWQSTRADLSFIPDCQPECSPPCVNGGVCLSANTCQCPTGYEGLQCQDGNSYTPPTNKQTNKRGERDSEWVRGLRG